MEPWRETDGIQALHDCRTVFGEQHRQVTQCVLTLPALVSVRRFRSAVGYKILYPSRLKKTNLAYQLLKVEHTPTRVSITRDNLAPIVTPANGQTIRWKREDGELFDVNTVWEQGSLKQTFVAKDGSRENLLTLSPDGATLVMQVTIRSPRLPALIVYKLDYKRKA